MPSSQLVHTLVLTAIATVFIFLLGTNDMATSFTLLAVLGKNILLLFHATFANEQVSVLLASLECHTHLK
jgi:hypothetical protein